MTGSYPPTHAEDGELVRVLLVEDDPSVGKVMARGLERLGFHAHLLCDPREALASVTAAPTSCDVVITDLAMPGMNGVELARQLLAVRTDLSDVR